MSRFTFAILLASLTALLMSQVEGPVAAGQDKKDKKSKKAESPVIDPKDAEQEDSQRAMIAFDPGSHTRPITALGFNKDQTKLITVGWDYSIQIWSTATGERLDILRLPPYGRDNGFDGNRWNHAAISDDAAFVVIGGGPKLFGVEKERTFLVVVDVVNRRVRRIDFHPGVDTVITGLTISGNGDRIAIGTGGATKAVYLLDDVKTVTQKPADAKGVAPQLVTKNLTHDCDDMALSRSGDRLAFAEQKAAVSSWDVSGKVPAKWSKLGQFDAGRTDVLAWSPDETNFARSWVSGGGAENRGIEIRSPDGKQLKNWTYREMTPGFGTQTVAASFRYLAADRLFISAHAGISRTEGYGPMGVLLDPTTGKTVRRFSDGNTHGMFTPFGNVSEKGELAATTTAHGLEAVIYRLADGKVVSHCGNRTPTPTLVGWATDPKAPAVAWADEQSANPFNTKPTDLKYGFDLSKLEPLPEVVGSAFDLRRVRSGEWSLEFKHTAGAFLDVHLKQDGKGEGKLFRIQALSLTLVPNGKAAPLLAYGSHDYTAQMGAYTTLLNAEGGKVASWLPMVTTARDMVSSPDGRFVLATTGTHRISIYRTDGSRFPFMNLVRVNGEWVAWTPEGYYAASAGGDKLIGWSVHNGANDFATFYPAERYSKQFHRPDVLKLAIEKGSVKEALVSLNTVAPELEKILPPAAKMELVEQRGATVKVKVSASSGAKDKPVTAMRVLLDGRPLPNGRGVWTPVEGKPAQDAFEFEVPAGLHELKVLARSADGSTVSEPLVVRGPKAADSQPTIYRVCVGVNDYDEAKLKLSAATKDAKAMFAALEQYCVGSDNRFGAAKGELILNKDATRERVLKALEATRKAAKPGDLVVVFFAGHGVKQADTFYLLTREVNISEPFKGKSLSGDDLRTALKDVECPVLLLLDACHSAAGVKSFRPATDDLTRTLTDDTVGVTVMSAAMSHETAGETTENGFFTAGLLKGLKAGEGVPFDPYEGQMYVHHLYSVAFSEVRRATGGKQNPFLNMPWTVPPLPVREIAK